MNFQVVVEGLPEDYLIKSITYGSTDVTNGTFRMTPSNFQTVTTAPPPSSLLAPPAPSAGTPIAEVETQLRAFLTAINASTQVTNAVSPPSTLSIILRRAQQIESLGVRVSGRLTVPGNLSCTFPVALESCLPTAPLNSVT
jgi:hypothetical protein